MSNKIKHPIINSNTLIYLCATPEKLGTRPKSITEMASHKCDKLNDRTFLYPTKIDSETINPQKFNELKNHYNIIELLFIDRISGADKAVSIINHINRSGQNFLRNKTPFEKFPQFPDMSKIYNKISGFESTIVHTIGSKRFKNISSDENVVWNESIGLIAPVAHYVGIKVFAIGVNNFDDINKIL